MSGGSKVQTRESLRGLVDRWHQQREQVVLANGCFDLLHVGHVRYLRGAKALGGKLIELSSSEWEELAEAA